MNVSLQPSSFFTSFWLKVVRNGKILSMSGGEMGNIEASGAGSVGSERNLQRPLPYVGGVFIGGGLDKVAEAMGWPPHVKIFEVDKELDRDLWCLYNIKRFNTFKAESWYGVVGEWDVDIRLASEAKGIERTVEIKQTERLIKDMMAVSASARAMEASVGNPANYLKIISQGLELEGGSLLNDYIVHNDPRKINNVINHPLVKHYYSKLLEDSGVDVVNEWTRTADPENPKKFKNNVSRIRIPDKEKAKNGRLVHYLSGKAFHGGIEAYINDLVVDPTIGVNGEHVTYLGKRGVDPEVRRIAAKLACDAFMIDKYTRWEYLLDKDGKQELQPIESQWAGDPFRQTLEPSFLPRRIKKVYAGNDSLLLDMIDETFRPLDIFYPGSPLSKDIVHATAVENLSKWYKLNSAISKFMGNPTASNISVRHESETPQTLLEITKWLYEVYGNVTLKPEDVEKYKPYLIKVLEANNRKFGKKTEEALTNLNVPIGKHIVGAMVGRILHTKALATALESGTTSRELLRIAFNPEQAEAAPFKTLEQFLWGPNLDGSEGYLKMLTSALYDLKIDNNIYLRRFGEKGNDEFDEAAELLRTTEIDERKRRKYAIANHVGFILQVGDAMQKAFIRGGGIK